MVLAQIEAAISGRQPLDLDRKTNTATSFGKGKLSLSTAPRVQAEGAAIYVFSALCM
jgi:hypothetical protein